MGAEVAAKRREASPRPSRRLFVGVLPGFDDSKVPSQRVQSTYIVECRVSILGITIMIWEGIPHNSTLDPLGLYRA